MRFYLAVLALVVACSNDSRVEGNNDNTPDAIPEDTLPSFVAEAQCNLQMACDCYVEVGPVGQDPAEYTRTKCIENRKLELSYWQGRMHKSGLVYDSDCAARRLAVAQQWACGDTLDVAEIDLATGDCRDRCRVYHGDLELGEICNPTNSNIDDCAQGLACRPVSYDPNTGMPTSRCVSTCAGVGELCFYEECAPGLMCRYDNQSGTQNSRCETAPQPGEACVDYSCGVGSFCNQNNVCAAFLDDGAVCNPAIPCRGACIENVCQDGAARVCTWDLRQ